MSGNVDSQICHWLTEYFYTCCLFGWLQTCLCLTAKLVGSAVIFMTAALFEFANV
jgi:hypothetical protein